jgi:hypothetical protein
MNILHGNVKLELFEVDLMWLYFHTSPNRPGLPRYLVGLGIFPGRVCGNGGAFPFNSL